MYIFLYNFILFNIVRVTLGWDEWQTNWINNKLGKGKAWQSCSPCEKMKGVYMKGIVGWPTCINSMMTVWDSILSNLFPLLLLKICMSVKTRHLEVCSRACFRDTRVCACVCVCACGLPSCRLRTVPEDASGVLPLQLQGNSPCPGMLPDGESQVN